MQANDEDNPNPYESSQISEPRWPKSRAKQATLTILGCSVVPACFIAFMTTCTVAKAATGWRYEPVAWLIGGFSALCVYYVFWKRAGRSPDQIERD